MRTFPRHIAFAALFAFAASCTLAAPERRAALPSTIPGQTNLVHLSPTGQLTYAPYDAQGDTLPDFSMCGYAGGGVSLPTVPTRATLTPDPHSTDDGPRIQAALDALAKLPLQPDGYRGALLLTAGTYNIKGTLELKTSGVVLRGQSDAENGTLLLATTHTQHDLIHIRGEGESQPISSTLTPVTDPYVPVGATQIHVKNAAQFKIGDTVIVTRPSTQKWIHFIKMDQIGGPKPKAGTVQWSPGAFDLHFDRVITAIDNNTLTLDAPIVNPMDQQWGISTVVKYVFPGRIEHVGIETLRGDSVFNSPTDEDHGWNLITISSAQNTYVRNVTARHFGYSCVTVGRAAKWCTVQDSACIDAISQITGGRRYSFGIQGGTLSLVQRCTTRDGRHDYVLGARTAGPNAFIFCHADKTHADTGPHHRWSCGCLFDNLITTGDVDVEDRQAAGSGHGWAGAQMVFWNCTTGPMVCQQPPTAQNFAIGCNSAIRKGHWAEHPNGWIESLNHPVPPKSLFQTQLIARLGPTAWQNIQEQLPAK